MFEWIHPFSDNTIIDSVFSIVTRRWDFGDGTIQSLGLPPYQHTYTKAGSYTVKLTVTDAAGCTDSLVKQDAVLITDPKARFSVDSVRCSKDAVQFKNQSQGVSLQYKWFFGDGGTSTTMQPLHNYASEGIYTVKLIITDKFACADSLSITNAVRIANPKADFITNDTISTCPPFEVKLNNASKNFSSVKWSFGDGSFSDKADPSHFYNFAGTYTLNLTAFGYGSCADSISKTIVVKGPSGSLVYDTSKLCLPGAVTFTASTKNNASFIWDFSDGNTLVTTDSVVSHTYTSTGIFTPRILLIDVAGCRVPIAGPSQIVVADVKAAIKSFNKLFCDSGLVAFEDSSISFFDNITNYKWLFGDGGSSINKNPSHNYNVPGTYAVTLMVSTSAGCKDTVQSTNQIKVVTSPSVNISGDSAACMHQPIDFTGNILGQDTSSIIWNWTFGNGNISTSKKPLPQVYGVAGNYKVLAFAKNSYGCIDTATHLVTINPTPNVDAGKDSIICLGQQVMLQPSGATSYTWAANATLSCINCSNPIASPQDTLVKYFVVGSNQFSCSSEDSIVLKVIQPSTVSATPGATICAGQSTYLFARGADVYIWSPSVGLSNSAIANPIAAPLQTTNYQVVGTDFKNCFADTANVLVTVFPIPKINIVESNLSISVGNGVDIATQSSIDVNQWRWTPSTGLNCTTCPQPNASPRSTTTYTLKVYNDAGCTATDNVTIQVICNNGNFYFPNTFSPNGDGMNDTFYPRGKGIAGIRSFTIYNRWGQVVFQKMNFAANDASSGWDGTYAGTQLSADVYVYFAEIICENNQIFSTKGNITLIK